MWRRRAGRRLGRCLRITRHAIGHLRESFPESVDALYGCDVFISYGQRDSLAYADTLAEALRSGVPGLRVFRDIDDFQAGEVLADATVRAVRRSSALVVVATPAALRSEYVALEWLSKCHPSWCWCDRRRHGCSLLLSNPGLSNSTNRRSTVN